MTHTLAQALQYADGARDLLLEQLADTKFPSTPRNDLVLAYVAIAIEHQEAIVKLVGLHLYAPAFALLRLELETMFRGLWANLIADDSQIAAVAQEGAEPFPRFKAFAKILDESYGADGWIAGFGDRWTTLNGFTHSGLEQLGRRFHDDGNV